MATTQRPIRTASLLPRGGAGLLLLTVGLSLLATFVGWHFAWNRAYERANQEIAVLSHELELELNRQLHAYRLALESGRALFAASEEVTRGEWRAFVEAKNFAGNYPGLLGMAYVVAVEEDQLDAFVQETRDDHAPWFDVKEHPRQDRAADTHYIITYHAPDARNRAAVGLNLATYQASVDALHAARDSGSIAMTRSFPLVQEEGNPSAVVAYLPVYRSGAAVETVEQRRANIVGWISAPICVPDLMEAGWLEQFPELHVHLYETCCPAGPKLLFDSITEDSVHADSAHLAAHKATIHFAGREWKLVSHGDLTVTASDAMSAWGALVGGGAITLLLGAVVWSLLRTRAHALKLANDITENLRRSSELLEQTQVLGRIGGWEMDLKTNDLYWTNEVYRIHEVDENYKPTVERAIDFYHPDSMPHLRSAMSRAVSELKPFDLELRFITQKRNALWVRAIGKPVIVDGEAARLTGTFQDITAQVAARDALAQARDEAQNANTAKSEFLANMSHEIRTPLTAILGYADLLTEPQLPEADRRDNAHIIRRNGNHLLTIINDILDLSKIEAGKLNVEHLDTDPRSVVNEVLSLMRLRADAKGLRLAAQCDTPIPRTVRTDPVRLRQILMNLLGNAIKFTHAGSVTVGISYDPHKQQLALRVTDTGMGMDKQQIARLYRPFVQADSSTTRRFGGTGLGLTLTKRLAEMLGGDIRVESVPDQGSTFTVTLGVVCDPRAVLVQTLEDPSQPETPPAAGESIAGRILLAEDGPDNQRLISHILRKSGLTVDVADNGRIALEMALAARDRNQAYDLILMDMQMPEMDGYTATTHLRDAGYAGPIIALTAHAMAGDRDKCIAAGCDDYATKPIQKTQLLAMIQQTISTKRAA